MPIKLNCNWVATEIEYNSHQPYQLIGPSKVFKNEKYLNLKIIPNQERGQFGNNWRIYGSVSYAVHNVLNALKHRNHNQIVYGIGLSLTI